MSYILDALKRADAERERGAVPGLHAQGFGHLGAAQRPPGHARWGVMAGLALAVVAAGGWFWRSAPPQVSMAPALNTAPAQTEPHPLASAAAAAQPQTGAIKPPEVIVAPPALIKVQPKPVASTATAAPATRPPPPAPEAKTVPAPAALAKPTAPPAASPASAPPSASNHVVLLSELPDDIRRQLPALSVTGAVYSEQSGQWMLLVNGLVLTQGGVVAPGLKVEEIQTWSSVFSFQGTRFRVEH